RRRGTRETYPGPPIAERACLTAGPLLTCWAESGLTPTVSVRTLGCAVGLCANSTLNLLLLFGLQVVGRPRQVLEGLPVEIQVLDLRFLLFGHALRPPAGLYTAPGVRCPGCFRS